MGYSPNGTAGMMYEEEHCSRCIHYGEECRMFVQKPPQLVKKRT